MENNKQEENAKKMLLSLGLDINDEHLQDTPKRIVKMYKEVFSGLLQENEPKFTVFNNPDYNEMIIIQGKFSSMCSHHFLPFLGEFYFGYIPDKKICGLSKIPRVVEYFAKRPQVQERLTQQIIDYLDEKLKPKGCILVMKAKHYCSILRGVKQDEDYANTTTSAVKGIFLKPEPGKNPKEEFLSLIKNGNGVH